MLTECALLVHIAVSRVRQQAAILTWVDARVRFS